MIDSLGAINRKGAHITPWGTPHPYCPGCHQLPKSIPQSHACPELNGLVTTARVQCPFCEGQERAEGAFNEADREKLKNEIEKSRIGSADEFGAKDFSYIELEELERKASAIRALEAEAEAREAKAQERLRQVEARLRQEMSRRSELQRKTQEIEEELKRQPETGQSLVEHSQIEAVRITPEASDRFEEEREARIAAEGAAKAEAEAAKAEAEAAKAEAEAAKAEAEAAKAEGEAAKAEAQAAKAEAQAAKAEAQTARAEAKAKLLEMEARVSETAERLRQSDAGLQREASKRALAEGKAKELEVRLAAETGKIRSEAEAKIQGMGAEARRIEENYKVEIDWLRGELEETLATARRAEESHRAEMTRITFEAESRALQAEANASQYQIKVEEAIASAQSAMFNLEETQKKLQDAEARFQEMEIKARRAETRSLRLRLISKLAYTSAEEVLAETIGVGDENENEKDATVISINHSTTTYLDLDNLPAEAPGFITDGSMDFGGHQFSERMKALFQAAARANAITLEDNNGKVDNDELRIASGE
ncbi:MAG: hypothetical protein J2P21_26395 [Chloracidobacterium sp.]|nr:hypothetical protein [Chloracidobacterium sp.]